VHLSRRAFVGPDHMPDGSLRTGSVVAALRERLYHAGATAADPQLRARFLARYPSSAAFDAWALKRLLDLNPDVGVVGIDDAPLPEGPPVDVFAAGSRLPDDDGRNANRFRHDAGRRVAIGQYGRPLPEDPATLEMGALTGISSQAHAHYGLPHLLFSDDPEVLKRDPRRFAIPPTVHTFGAAFAEVYLQLAVIAAALPGGAVLRWLFAGAAAHHVEDVANQIHTVQVGIYDFFVDAKLESIKADLLTAGGLLGHRPTFVSLGIDIITNHHILAETLFAKHLLEPNDPVAQRRADPDAELQRALDAVPACAPEIGRAIAEALIERSSYEGPEVYRAIRDVAERRWSRAGNHFEESDDPDRAIRSGVDLSHFYALELAGAARSDQAVSAMLGRIERCAADFLTADRFAAELVKERLLALDESEARARAWVEPPPTRQEISYWIPTAYAVAVGATILLAVRARQRWRNKGQVR
jgi:hypothetical protein